MYETWHPNCDAPNRVKGRINYTVLPANICVIRENHAAWAA
jgi:hypothetical protein